MIKRIMLVDDDLNICKVTSIYLKKAGYEVVQAYDGEQAIELFENTTVDAVILDLMLPKLDGMKVCGKIRSISSVPIIMLTAKGQTSDKIEGLQLGADDYIVKPFDPNELIARLQAVLRRTKETQTDRGEVIVLGNLEINPVNHTVTVNENSIKIPKKEFELLLFLVKHPSRVFSRNDLIEKIWGWDFEGEDRVVDLYIKRLRARLTKAENQSVMIKTVWGVGYQLESTSI